jgi:hypothetical protein
MRQDTLAVSATPAALDFTAADFVVDLAFAAALAGAVASVTVGGGWPGYGLFLATLPLYSSTVWWNGVPYYYADDYSVK